MRKKGKFQGDLYIKSLNKTKLDENKNLIKIILGKYKLNIKNLDLTKKNLHKVKEIIEINSLGLIDYIGIGYNYNNTETIILYEEYRDLEKLIINSEIQIEIDKDIEKDLYIKIVDVFGNESYKILG